MLRYVDITADKDLLRYQEETYKRLGVRFPLEYLKRSRVVGLIDSNGQFKGGYALVMKGPFRVIEQIPQEVIANDSEIQEKLGRSLEITGLWLDTSIRGGFHRSMLWLNIFFDILLSGKTYFVYSYDADSKKLGEMYGLLGAPTLVYKGPVKALEGMGGVAIEYVEIGSLQAAITTFFTRPDFLISRILFPRRLHLNKMFLKKAYSYSMPKQQRTSVARSANRVS